MAPATPTISTLEYARDHGVSIRRVQQWIAEGMPYRQVAGARRIVRRDANAWRDARLEARTRAAAGPVKASVERARKLRAEADLKELEVAERRRELVPIAEYRERLEAFVGGFAAVATGQLARFERDIMAASGAGEARRVTQAIHAALMAGAHGYASTLEAEPDP